MTAGATDRPAHPVSAGTGFRDGRGAAPADTPPGTRAEARLRPPPRSTAVRVLPVGDRALLVEVSSGEAAQALHAELLRRRSEGSLAGARDRPGRPHGAAGRPATTRPGVAERLPGWEIPPPGATADAEVEIRVRYDGPDLADVAAAWGVPVHRGAGPPRRGPSSGWPSAGSRPASGT